MLRSTRARKTFNTCRRNFHFAEKRRLGTLTEEFRPFGSTGSCRRCATVTREEDMLKKSVPTLIVAAMAAFGTVQLAHAQKNYTEGGDLYGGGHTKKKANPNTNAAKSGKFDTYTDGAKQSTQSDLNANGKKFDPYSEGAKTGKSDPYTEGAKSGKFDPYSDGAKAPEQKQ